jgi:septal ring factor EnvC (AmiA/AmiB activator)
LRPFIRKSASTLLCAVLALGCASLADARPTERTRQKADAEARRAGIQKQLQELKREISRTESEKEDASDALSESEAAISDANRALHDLAQEQQDTNARLQAIADEQARLARTIESQKQQLATLLRQHYVAGNEDRIKLLLSGDNPNRINRDLQMMAYVSQAQAKLLGALRANLAQLEANRDKVQEAKDDLEEIAQEQREAKAKLEREKANRATLLASVSTKLVSQRKQAGKLERDEQRLSGLVDQLAQIIRGRGEEAPGAAGGGARQGPGRGRRACQGRTRTPGAGTPARQARCKAGAGTRTAQGGGTGPAATQRAAAQHHPAGRARRCVCQPARQADGARQWQGRGPVRRQAPRGRAGMARHVRQGAGRDRGTRRRAGPGGARGLAARLRELDYHRPRWLVFVDLCE